MFDPYRKWLGIQPKDQPPNHYRLLGVDLFEDDLDVIEGAADRLMNFVRQYQSGEHAGDAARILNELAAARLCLLKPTTKAAYDKKLRQAEAASVPTVESTFADLPFTDADLPSVRSPRKKSTAKSKLQGPSSQLLIAGGIGAVVCLILVIFLMSGRRDRLVEKSTEPKPASSAKPVAPDQVPATPDSTAKVDPSPSHPYAWVPTALVTDPIGEPIDLLKLVDLNRDVNAGKWDQTKTALIGDRHSRLYLPTRLPDDYQLKLTVRRMEGIDTLKIGFMMGGRQGMLALDGWSSTQSGLYLDGREPNSNCTTRPGKLFQDQSAATIVLTIHPRHVHVSFDGKPIVDVFGNPERLDLYQNAVMPSRESPFLETADAKYVFESITLVPIKPEPPVVRPARLDREIDILPLVDLDTDMQQGIWSIQKNTLYSPEKNGKLYLPTVVPEEYTLSATVEMNSEVRGIFAFVVGLVADQTNFRFVAADGDTGLDMVDGQRWWFNNTRIRGPILKAGVPAKLAMTVTKGGVRVDVDNRTIIDWRGDVRRLATAGDAQLKDARRLVLEASHHCKIRDLKLGPPVGPLNYSIHPPVPAGKSIDLLSVIDHQRDAFWGTWQRDGNALRCMGDDPASKLVIPCDVPGDFKLSMRVTRVEGGKSNDEAMFLGFPFESSRAAIVIDGRASKMTGLYLDGVDIDQNPFTHRVGPVLTAGTPCDVVLTVQNHRLQLRINDAPILDWNGNSKRCSVPSEIVTPGRWLSLASYQQGFRFEKLDLELLGTPTERSAAKLSADGKLLPILDLDRDVRRGVWKLDKEGLTCPTTPGCRLRIPVSPPTQYVFSAQVERKQGDDDLYFGLRVGQYAAGFGIDGMNGREAGVDSLDGMRYIASMNPTNRKYAAALLPKDQSVLVRCYVLPDTIVVTCGDKIVGRWHGDPRRLAAIPDFNPWNYTEEDRTHLWVGSWGTQFLFRDLELKPLSDTEAAEILKSFSGVFPLSSQSAVPLAPFNGNPANFADTPPVIPAKR